MAARSSSIVSARRTRGSWKNGERVVEPDVAVVEVVELDEAAAVAERRVPGRLRLERRLQRILVQLARGQQAVGRRVVRKDAEEHAVEVAARARIGRIALELDRLLGLPGHDPVGPVGERRPVVPGLQKVLLRESVLGQHRQREGHRPEGVRLAEARPEAAVVDPFDGNEVLEQRLEDAGGNLRVDDLADREDRVARRHRPAVLPDCALPEGHGVVPAIRRDLVAFGEARHEVHPGIEVEEVALHELKHLGLERARLHHGVEARGLAQEALPQHAALDRGFAGFVEKAELGGGGRRLRRRG